jgi:flagellar basal body-associated protein FliL
MTVVIIAIIIIIIIIIITTITIIIWEFFSSPSLQPTQPPIQWVQGAFSLGVKRPRREADHSPPSSAEVKECVELYLHSPTRLHGVVLSLKKKHRDLTL